MCSVSLKWNWRNCLCSIYVLLTSSQEVTLHVFKSRARTFIAHGLFFHISFIKSTLFFADPGIGEVCSVPLDHFDVCKPRHRNCFLYKQLTKMINKIIANYQENKNLWIILFGAIVHALIGNQICLFIIIMVLFSHAFAFTINVFDYLLIYDSKKKTKKRPARYLSLERIN